MAAAKIISTLAELEGAIAGKPSTSFVLIAGRRIQNRVPVAIELPRRCAANTVNVSHLGRCELSRVVSAEKRAIVLAAVPAVMRYVAEQRSIERTGAK